MTQPTSNAELLRSLADRIDAGKVENVEVHHYWQRSSDEVLSRMQAVVLITVTLPPDPPRGGYSSTEIQ